MGRLLVAGGRARHADVGGGAFRHDALGAKQAKPTRQHLHLCGPAALGTRQGRGRAPRRQVRIHRLRHHPGPGGPGRPAARGER